MPAAMPLSITVLVSWCAIGHGGWLSTLPIDEAVPMFFRLDGSARRGDDKSVYPLREPLCRGSIGISTDESWPPLRPGARVYVFAPRPWTPLELAALPAVPSGRRAPALQYDSTQELPPNDTGLPPARFPAASSSESPAEENLP